MLQNNLPQYNRTYLSADELDARLTSHGMQLLAPKILDAYEMSRSVHDQQVRNDGTPYFYHCSRVAKILMDELHIFDADILIAALLHDVLEDSETVTKVLLNIILAVMLRI